MAHILKLRIYHFWPNYFWKLSSVWLRRSCLFAWRTDGHNSGVFRRWMEICEWKHEYNVHQLHATWIKPEVVATKKYTGYLHYRFITTGSRFLWSPCCSYMCFFISCVALPIVCPSMLSCFRCSGPFFCE
jgi:hypothetical protein